MRRVLLLTALAGGVLVVAQTPNPPVPPPSQAPSPLTPPKTDPKPPTYGDVAPVRDGVVMDEEEPLGVVLVAREPRPVEKPAPAPKAKPPKKEKPLPAQPRAPRGPVDPETATLVIDTRSQYRIWNNRESGAGQSPAFPNHAPPLTVQEFIQQFPAIIPMAQDTFSPSQQVVLNDLQGKLTELDGFVRGYRRTTSPSGTFATLWVGPAQSSPFSACILVRVPAKRLPPRVNEHFFHTAALRGWPIRATGYPHYQLQTKYRVGIDRALAWELAPTVFCEIEAPDDIPIEDIVPPLAGKPHAGPNRAWRKIHR